MHSLLWRKAFPLLRRKPKATAAIGQGTSPADAAPARRDRQLNIKVSEDCARIFAALARAQKISKAALFEDMIVGRLDEARRQGIDLKV